MENPIVHVHNFLTKCAIKMNGVFVNAVWLRLFTFSLKYRASDWFQNEKQNSFTIGTLS